MSIDKTEPFGGDGSLQAGIARLIPVCAASVFASLTVLTHLAQIFGIRFDVFAIAGVSIAVITTTVVLYFEVPKMAKGGPPSDRRVTVVLLACCLLAAVLCLVSYRPDTDDCFYVPNVVYYLEHPSAPMGFVFHYIEAGREPLVSYHRGSIPFEYIQGIAAYLGRLNLLTVYYVLAPALVGFMIPLVWYYLLSRFMSTPSAIVFGTFLICLCLLLMGGAHRSFGNFAFNRIFQGKTVVLAMGIPLYAAITIDYFRSPTVRNWLYLLVVSTAMIGCTVAAAMLVPLFAIVLALAGSVSYVSGWKPSITRAIAYLCSLAYPAVYAGSILLLSTDQVGSESSLNRSWPATFLGHLKFVMSDPAVVMFLATGTIASATYIKDQNRRFLIAWLVGAAVLYLNPVVAPFMIKYVTSPNAYWRLFYLLPFPLVIGLSGAALVEFLNDRPIKWRILVPGTLVLLLLLAHIPNWSTSVFRSQTFIFENRLPRSPTKLEKPGYKVANLALTRQVLDSCPREGTMLAPQSISTVAAMLTARFTHICYRFDGIRLWFETDGRTKEAESRMRASQCLRGKFSHVGIQSVKWLLERYPQINTVVANKKAIAARSGDLGRHLGELGFTLAGDAEDMQIFSRPKSE